MAKIMTKSATVTSLASKTGPDEEAGRRTHR